MTRLASIMGVATVATMLLLSGCESPMTTDYAKDLAGNWTATLPRTINIPATATTPATMLPGMTAVEAAVTRTGTNEGSVSLKITDTPTGLPALPTTEVTGDIEVTATEIMVSGVMVNPQAALAQIPEGVAAGLTQGLTLTYEFADDGSKLKIGNTTLFPVLLGPTEVTLIKEPASN